MFISATVNDDPARSVTTVGGTTTFVCAAELCVIPDARVLLPLVYRQSPYARVHFSALRTEPVSFRRRRAAGALYCDGPVGLAAGNMPVQYPLLVVPVSHM